MSEPYAEQTYGTEPYAGEGAEPIVVVREPRPRLGEPGGPGGPGGLDCDSFLILSSLILVIGNFGVRWTGAPDARGLRGFSLSGVAFDQEHAEALMSLLDNPERRVGVSGEVGVLDFLEIGHDYAPFRGWVLLQSVDIEKGPNLDADTVGHGVFTLNGLSLGWRYEPVVVRGARPVTNAYSLAARALVVQPFWGPFSNGDDPFVPTQASPFVREYDANTAPALERTANPDAKVMRLHAATVTETSDPLPSVLRIGFQHTQDPPEWVLQRGGDCRAYDRRFENLVLGPGHAFRVPTDALITNGLVRAWCGMWGSPPYLQLQAFADGQWNEMGCVWLAPRAGQARLRRARLAHVTPDEVTLALECNGDLGNVFVSLRRGERMLRVKHGEGLGPHPASEPTRHIEISNVPPWISSDPSTVVVPGKFEQAWETLGEQGWWFPARQVDTRRFGQALWWSPTDDSTTQLDSVLFEARALDGLVMSVIWRASDQKLVLTRGTDVLESDPLVFAAADWVFVSAQTSDTEAFFEGCSERNAIGLALTWAVPSGLSYVVSHVADPTALDEPSPEPTLETVVVGPILNGAVDEFRIFDSWLTRLELQALSLASSATSGMPGPEGKIVMDLNLDLDPVTNGSALSNGRRFESTTEGGATPVVQPSGLLRAVATLEGSPGAPTGLALTKAVRAASFAAVLAKPGSAQDDLTAHHAQLACDSFQQIRVR